MAEAQLSMAQRWEQLHNTKTTILRHCEKYAAWTLPYLFPPEGNPKDTELPVELDSIGSQGVNHLANKVVSTLFPARSLFFRLVIDQDVKDLIQKGIQAAGQLQGNDLSGDDMQTAIQTKVAEAETQLLAAEKRASEHLDMVKYRPQAINAVKLLIVTGNAMIFHPEDGGAVQVYNLRNYHVVRDCNNEMVEFMTREKKALETFHPDIQDKLRSRSTISDPAQTKGYNHDTEVCIYTRGVLLADGKYHIYQYADDVDLGEKGAYVKSELRWIPLTWNLVQGEDYGRGLVADFGGAFHSLNILNAAMLNLAAVAGDLKYFVDPMSVIDVERVQNSLPGSYHLGKAEHIGTPQFTAGPQVNFLESMIARYEKQISQAFMLTQQLRRDAERVTAAEIQQDADELEQSNAGVYSRLAADWQVPLANIALKDTDFEGVGEGITPRVITGMDSLSRTGEAQNMTQFLAMAGLLNSVPEDIRVAIKPNQYLTQIAGYFQVDYKSWVMSDSELQARQAQEFQQQQQLQAQQQEGAAQTAMVQGAAKHAAG